MRVGTLQLARMYAHAPLSGTQGTPVGQRCARRMWALSSCGVCCLGIAAFTCGKVPTVTPRERETGEGQRSYSWGPCRHVASVPVGYFLCTLALHGARNVLCPRNPVRSGSVYERAFANQQKSRGKIRSVRRRPRLRSARKTRIQTHLECCEHRAQLHRAGSMGAARVANGTQVGLSSAGWGEVRQG